jgi:hypothetical protein
MGRRDCVGIIFETGGLREVGNISLFEYVYKISDRGIAVVFKNNINFVIRYGLAYMVERKNVVG